MQFVRQEILSFSYSNITELYNAWSPLTTYTLELDENNLTNASMVYYSGFYWRSLNTTNLNHNPVETENVYWYKHSISNRQAMLDLSSQSKSIKNGGDLTVVFPQGDINTLGIGNYTAASVTIEVLGSDMSTVLFSFNTQNHTNDEVIDYWTYMYSDYNTEADIATKLSITVQGSYIRVIFHQGAGFSYTSCGFLVGGYPVFMGNTLWGVKFAYNSFATKEFDSLGALTIVKGATQDLVDCECDIETSYVNTIRRSIKNVYNDIVMFILDEREDSQYENLLTLGVIQDASVIMSYPSLSTISYSIMEAI